MGDRGPILSGSYVYKIRKVGKMWRLYHRHRYANVNEEHIVAESSYWEMVAWIATGDRTYARPGWSLVPSWCST